MVRNTKFTPDTPVESARPLRRSRAGWSFARVCRLAMWCFAAAFTVFWPLYAIYVLVHPVAKGDVNGSAWKVLVGILTFVYWVVCRLAVYNRPVDPPQRVVHEHYHRRRW